MSQQRGVSIPATLAHEWRGDHTVTVAYGDLVQNKDAYCPVVAAHRSELSRLNVLAVSVLSMAAGRDLWMPTSAESEWNALHATLSSCGPRAKFEYAPDKVGSGFPSQWDA